MITPAALFHAFKEWQVAVSALTGGKTVLLLRKGGIKELGGKFSVLHSQFLLYPTFEHQKPHLVKSLYAEQVAEVTSGRHPENVEIGSWAVAERAFSVSDPNTVARLFPFHIWSEPYIADRLRWKPHQPLTLLVLRAYHLERSQVISFDPSYGGCRSWLDLKEPIAITNSRPVLTDRNFNRVTAQISRIVKEDPALKALIPRPADC